MKSSQKKGFTLIELVVYVILLGVLMVFAINMALSMTRAFAQLRVSRDLNSSAEALFERATRDIRGAYDVDVGQSVLGSNPGVLMLDTKDASGAATTVKYDVESGAIVITEGGVSKGSILTTNTTASNFIVRELDNGKTKAVRMEATLSSTRGNVSETRNFYTTIVLRGTY